MLVRRRREPALLHDDAWAPLAYVEARERRASADAAESAAWSDALRSARDDAERRAVRTTTSVLRAADAAAPLLREDLFEQLSGARANALRNASTQASTSVLRAEPLEASLYAAASPAATATGSGRRGERMSAWTRDAVEGVRPAVLADEACVMAALLQAASLPSAGEALAHYERMGILEASSLADAGSAVDGVDGAGDAMSDVRADEVYVVERRAEDGELVHWVDAFFAEHA